MIAINAAATDRNALILSEIQVQEFSVEWNRAALAQEGDYICPDGQPIRRTSLERTLARAETVIPILRAALEPEPAAPSAALATLCAGLDLPQSAAGLAALAAEPLAELDPSDPVAVQVAHLTERLAALERQAQAIDVLLRAQLTETEAAQTYDDTASTREGYTHYQAWQQARRELETIADTYMRAPR